MGVPLATSATRQATTRAAELDSVRMACTQAIHTKSLLQDLQLDQPIALRVLTGGPLAEQLGLSRNNRHLHLWSWLGQFQLSKVGSQQNLAASLTYNLTASGLHRLLPKLKMHTRSADALALSTELGSGPAFFRSSSSSFFIGSLSLNPAMAQLTAKELAAAYCEEESLQKELEAAYCDEKSFQWNELVAAYLLGQTKARELQLPIAQLCFNGPTRVRELQLSLAQLCFLAPCPQDELTAESAYGSLRFSPTRARRWLKACSTRAFSTAAATAAGKLQVTRDLRRSESIHYVPLPQTMQRYLPLDDHDMYMDLCNVVQNNLAGKGPDPAGAEELRYENVFPNITTDSVDLVLNAETSYHPKRPANNGEKGEIGSINLRGGSSITFLFKFVATFIMAVWANLPFSLWQGMGMNAYFAYTNIDSKDQSHPVKKVMIAVAIESVIVIVMSWLAIRLMIFKIFSAWMLKAPMAGIGMFLAFLGLHSGNGIDLIRDHPAVLDDLVEDLGVIDNFMQKNFGEKELAEHYSLRKWLRELEKYCEYIGNISTSQLRVCQKVRHHLALQKRDRKTTNLDNELATNFANENLANLIFKKKLVRLLLERHFALAASFQLLAHKAWKKFRGASLEITFYNKRRDKELPQQLRREQLDHKAFWSASFKAPCLSTFDDNSFKEEPFEEETFTEESFADSSLEEETFSESSFEHSSFADSSLTEETFEKGTFDNSSLEASSFEESSFEESSFEESSLDTSSFEASSFDTSSFEESSFDTSSFEESSFDTSSFDKHSFYKSRLEESSLQPNSFEDSSLEDSSFQEDSLDTASFQSTALRTELAQLQRTASTLELSELERTLSTTELAQLERSTSRTELAELEHRALHTELAQPQRRAFNKSASREASNLSGPQLLTIWVQGGVARGTLPPSSLLDKLHLGPSGSRPARLQLHQKAACPLSLANRVFF